MTDRFHRPFSWVIVLTIGLIVCIIEAPIKMISFLTALVLYIVFSITAPLWIKTNLGWCGDFINWSFSLKFRMAIKVMRAYCKALGLSE